MKTESKPKKAYPLKRVVNWYFGNYCIRKCFDKPGRIDDHHRKLMLFVDKNPKLTITHQDFLQLFNNHISICNLKDNFKKKYIGWKLFEKLNRTPNYDSDKIVVKKGIVQREDEHLDKPRMCEICKGCGLL